MKQEMKVAVMTGLKEVELSTREVPKPKDHEVLVKLEYIGVCGSDLHYYETGAIGPFVVEPPFVLGHECAGTVVEVGAAVTNLVVGDRVALEPGTTCGVCELCRTGRYNLCPDVIFFATPPIDGVFQEYVAHHADYCFKLPEHVSTMEGALIEPLAVGFHGVFQGDAKIGQKVVIFGAGCIGLVSMLACKAMGISQIIMVDIIEKRLEKALELGASHVINGSNTDVVAKIKELTDGQGADLLLETAGMEITANQAIHGAKKGATIVLIGYSATGKMNLEVSHALDKEITFKTIFRYRHIYPIAIEAAASGNIDLKGMVTNVFDLDDIVDAMKQCSENKAEIVKAVVKVG